MEPRELVRESQRIHSVCLFELVRQVSVQCIERGLLLKRVWEYVLLSLRGLTGHASSGLHPLHMASTPPLHHYLLPWWGLG